MPFVFGAKSAALLANCHPMLERLCREALAISEVDFSILQSTRSREEQEAAFKKGTSKVHYGDSAHTALYNGKPRACAVDVLPYPFNGNWEDPENTKKWKQINDAFEAAAKKLGIEQRWGGDFNRDGDKTKNDAWDLPHHELHPWRDWTKKAA